MREEIYLITLTPSGHLLRDIRYPIIQVEGPRDLDEFYVSDSQWRIYVCGESAQDALIRAKELYRKEKRPAIEFAGTVPSGLSFPESP